MNFKDLKEEIESTITGLQEQIDQKAIIKDTEEHAKALINYFKTLKKEIAQVQETYKAKLETNSTGTLEAELIENRLKYTKKDAKGNLKTYLELNEKELIELFNYILEKRQNNDELFKSE